MLHVIYLLGTLSTLGRSGLYHYFSIMACTAGLRGTAPVPRK